MIHCLPYRQCFNPALNPRAAACHLHRQEDAAMLHLHHLRPVDHDVFLTPPDLAGRKITVLEKSDRLNLLSPGRVPPDGIAVSTTGPANLVLRID